MSNFSFGEDELRALADKLARFETSGLNDDERALMLGILRTAGVVFLRTYRRDPAIDLVVRNNRPRNGRFAVDVQFSGSDETALRSLRDEFLHAFALEDAPSNVYELTVAFGDGSTNIAPDPSTEH